MTKLLNVPDGCDRYARLSSSLQRGEEGEILLPGAQASDVSPKLKDGQFITIDFLCGNSFALVRIKHDLVCSNSTSGRPPGPLKLGEAR
jgi:hypothetical protein